MARAIIDNMINHRHFGKGHVIVAKQRQLITPARTMSAKFRDTFQVSNASDINEANQDSRCCFPFSTAALQEKYLLQFCFAYVTHFWEGNRTFFTN